MSLTQSSSDPLRQQRRELLLDLAKQAESRKLQVRKMLADCASEREKEIELQRGARREALQKISTDVRELRESSVRPATAVDAVEPAVSAAPAISAPAPISPSPTTQALPSPDTASAVPPSVQIKPAVPLESPANTLVRDNTLKPVPPNANVDSAFESRMSGLEEAFTKLVETVTEKLDYSSRILQVETQSKGLDLRSNDLESRSKDLESRSKDLESRSKDLESLYKGLDSIYKGLKGSTDEVSARLHPIENKYDVLRADHRSLELGCDRLSEQVKGFDQLFASLGRDAQKMSSTVEALTVEVRRVNERTLAMEKSNLGSTSERSDEITSLQDRLARLESGLVRTVGLLENSENSIADLVSLRERFVQMESGFQRVLKAVDSLQRPVEEPDSAAEREATANVLASLTKLVQGMRIAQNERQIQNGVIPA